MGNLQGKVALITGCAGKLGMGRAMANRLARDGTAVIINDISQFDIRHSEDDKIEGWQGLKSVESEISAMGGKVLAIEADISSSRQVDAMVNKAIKAFGKIDILVNNASILGQFIPAMEVSDEHWNSIISTNLTGTFYCCRAVAKRMVEAGKGGKRINISSNGGRVGTPNLVAYCSAKAGVLGLTETLARELAKDNICVNCITPGSVLTDMTSHTTTRKALREGVPFDELAKKASRNAYNVQERMGSAADIANMVAFLASSESDFITGQVLSVDGGWVISV